MKLARQRAGFSFISEDDKINPTKLNSYFSFMQVAKSANSKLFKDFCDEAEMEKNSQIVGFTLSSSLRKG
jgi:hypothetical protein